MRLLLLLALSWAGLASAEAQAGLRADSRADIWAEVAPVYAQGAAGSVAVEVVYRDPDGAFDEGVLFLNVVELDAARNWPQAAHRIFTGASESPSLFRRVLSAEDLAEGVSTTLRFTLRPGAPPGRYALVVQLYRGTATHPNRVRPEDRVLMRGFDFEIVPR